MAELLSHSAKQASAELDRAVEAITKRLNEAGDSKSATLAEKLSILDGMTKFEFGRFLLIHGGINSIWNHYVSYEFPRLPEMKKPKNPLERTLIAALGESELRTRLEMMTKLLQAELRDGIKILSVPCGVMADLSTLDYSGITDYRLFGADLDPQSIERAKVFNRQHGLEAHTEFACKDAWNLDLDGRFDIVTSMGLNMYVSEIEKMIELYKSFHRCLKSGGKLMVSYMTPHPQSDPTSERDMSSLDPEYVRILAIVFHEILQSRIVGRVSSVKITELLKSAGFSDVTIHYSKCKSPNIAVAKK